LEVYQLIAPALSLYYIYRIVVELRHRRKFIFTNFIWLGFWSVIAVLGVVPHEFSTQLANLLGIKSNINAIIFVSLAFVIVLAFYLSAKIENMDRKITELVRQLALDENKIRELERKRINEIRKQEKSKFINKI